MYNIGICDDGENICASVENMLLKYAEKKAVQVEIIWRGEIIWISFSLT